MGKLPVVVGEPSDLSTDLDVHHLTVEQLRELQFAIYPSRVTSLLWFLFWAFMGVAGIVMPLAWILGWGVETETTKDTLAMVFGPLIGFAGIAFSQQHLRGVLHPTPRILIDREGIWDRDQDPARIPWSEVCSLGFDDWRRNRIRLGCGKALWTHGLGGDLDAALAVMEQYRQRRQQLEAATAAAPERDDDPDEKSAEDAGAGAVHPLIRL